jgi:hypothetical protein
MPESKAYKLSPEAEKLAESNSDLFALLQSSEKPPEELQEQLQQFMETEGIQMSPETLMSEIRRLAVQAPPRG